MAKLSSKNIQVSALAKLLSITNANYLMVCELSAKEKGVGFDEFKTKMDELITQHSRHILFSWLADDELSDTNIEDLLK
jgi:hypothetical protein